LVAYLRGKVIEYGDEWVLLETPGGVGYKVFVTANTLGNIRKQGEEVRIYTYLSVKEDGWSLFGFVTREEKKAFELLLKVSGVGPKVALSILAVLSLAQIQRAIQDEDLVVLSKVPGIGKKTAQRLILELKDKFTGFSNQEESHNVKANQEVIEVLLALGYSNLEAKEAVDNVLRTEAKGENKNTEEMIRLALKYLAP